MVRASITAAPLNSSRQCSYLVAQDLGVYKLMEDAGLTNSSLP